MDGVYDGVGVVEGAAFDDEDATGVTHGFVVEGAATLDEDDGVLDGVYDGVVEGAALDVDDAGGV